MKVDAQVDLDSEIEAFFNAVAAPFDDELMARGAILERDLPLNQRALLEALEKVHFERSGTIGAEALLLGFELGKIFGKRPAVNPGE